MHIECGKDAYNASGRRHATKLEDMINKIQYRTLVSALGKRMRGNDDTLNAIVHEDEVEDMVTHKANASIFNTESGVIFEGSNTSSNIQELILERSSLKYKNTGRTGQTLLNPNTTLDLLWSSILRRHNDDVVDFCREFGTTIGIY